MKKINIRNIIITILCITIVFLSIGFIIISTKLQTMKTQKDIFKVSFESVEKDSIVKGGTKDPFCKNEITNEGYSINFNCTLYQEHDEVSYFVKVKNKGNIKAKIVELIRTPDYVRDDNAKKSISPISVTTTEVSGKTLSPGEETIIKVVAIYNKTKERKTLNFPYKLTLVTTSFE